MVLIATIAQLVLHKVSQYLQHIQYKVSHSICSRRIVHSWSTVDANCGLFLLCLCSLFNTASMSSRV